MRVLPVLLASFLTTTFYLENASASAAAAGAEAAAAGGRALSHADKRQSIMGGGRQQKKSEGGGSQQAGAAASRGAGGAGFKFPELDWSSKRAAPELVEVGDGIFYADGVLSDKEIKALCAATESELEPTNPRNLPPKRGEAFRNNDRFLQRDEDFADKLWKHKLEPICRLLAREDGARPTHVNPDIRVYRYRKGQSFGPHIDQPVLEGKSSESEFTVLIYLEGGEQLKGGDTIFHSRPPVSIKAVPGRVCLHWTGHDCLHEGELVTKGTKMVLRTDLFYPRR